MHSVFHYHVFFSFSSSSVFFLLLVLACVCVRRLLAMGFEATLNSILQRLPKLRRTVLFVFCALSLFLVLDVGSIVLFPPTVVVGRLNLK